MDFLAGLNPPQRAAVEHFEGPILILAGAGSGKTRVITHRIAHLICAHGVPPSAILAVTFTNKAASEMRERVGTLLGTETPPSGLTVATFHSFCVRLLRRDGARLADLRPGFTRDFQIYADDEQLALIKGIYKQFGLNEEFMKHRSALSIISQAKNQGETPRDFYQKASDPRSKRLASVFEEYESRLRQANALDFDDLLQEAVRLLRHDAVTREAYNRRLSYLMVDEYQDTNRVQYDLMRLLSVSHKNVCAVGDEDQSIYSWRGADINNILDFESDYPDALVIRLEQNYRSTKNILEAASTLIAHNKERKGKWLWTDIAVGEKVALYEAYDGEREALFIANTAEKLLNQNPGESIAVLYRTNAQSRQIEEALRRYGRRYVVVGGFSFYQRAEVRDILAYLKTILSPADTINLLRIVNKPARGIGKTSTDQVERYAEEHKLRLWDAMGRMLEEKQFPTRAAAAIEAFRKLILELQEAAAKQDVGQVVRLILERTGYREMLKADSSPESDARRENLNELLNAAVDAAERGESIPEFLDHAALVSDADSVDEAAEVSLLTMHNAKGLEFPVVFIAGMEEKLFPHSRSYDSEAMMEEERRLCYVGMTRARRRLYLTWARQRRRWGGGAPEPCACSRFVSEVPIELTDYLGESPRRMPSGFQTPDEVDLLVERHEVKEAARRNTYTGKTYNSLDNISQFFEERGLKPPVAGGFVQPPPQAPPAVRPVQPGRQEGPPRQATKPRGLKNGATVDHPRYGKGVVLRREGEGDNAKITVSFPGYGLKKLIAKYAGLKVQE
jgi:DNA helicase-2/ATP-dependent DNA helicase PcrA